MLMISKLNEQRLIFKTRKFLDKSNINTLINIINLYLFNKYIYLEVFYIKCLKPFPDFPESTVNFLKITGPLLSIQEIITENTRHPFNIYK